MPKSIVESGCHKCMDKAFADTGRHCPSCPCNSREMIVSTSTCICHLRHHRQISISTPRSDDGRCRYILSADANVLNVYWSAQARCMFDNCFRFALVENQSVVIEPRFNFTDARLHSDKSICMVKENRRITAIGVRTSCRLSIIGVQGQYHRRTDGGDVSVVSSYRWWCVVSVEYHRRTCTSCQSSAYRWWCTWSVEYHRRTDGGVRRVG